MPVPVILADGVQPPPIGSKANGTKAVGASVTLTLQNAIAFKSFVWSLDSAPAGSAAALGTPPSAPFTTTVSPLDVEGGTYILSGYGNNDQSLKAQIALVVPTRNGLRTPAAGEETQWDPARQYQPDHKALVDAVDRIRIDVRSPAFGAVGDGIANDTAAVLAAYNTAKAAALISATGNAIVYFPPGRYRITQASATTIGLDLGSPTCPVTFEGDGDLSEIFFDNINTGISCNAATGYIAFRRLKISGTYGRFFNIASNTAGMEFIDLDVSGACQIGVTTVFPAAIHASDCNDVWIEGCVFHGNGQTGAKTARTYAVASDPSLNARNWHIRGNTLVGDQLTVGFALFDITDSDITGNTITMGGVSAIYDAQGGDGYGILVYAHLTPAKNVVVTGNVVRNCAGSGIYCAATDHTSITNNSVRDCCLVMLNPSISIPYASVAITGNQCIVSGNTIDGGSRYGIMWQGTQTQVFGNKLANTGEAGLFVFGASTYLKTSLNTIDGTRGRNPYVYSTAICDFAAIGAAAAIGTTTLSLKIDNGTTAVVTFQSTDTTGPLVAKRISDRLLALAAMSAVSSSGGGARPTITLTGTLAKVPVTLLVVAVTTTQGRYSVDNGATWTPFAFIPSTSVLLLDSAKVSTGITMNIGAGTVTAADAYSATTVGAAICHTGVDTTLLDGAFPTSLLIQSLSQGVGSGTYGEGHSVRIVGGTTGVVAALGLQVGDPTFVASSLNGLAFGAASYGIVTTSFGVSDSDWVANSINGSVGALFQFITRNTFTGGSSANCGASGVAVISGSKNKWFGYNSSANTGAGFDIRTIHDVLTGCTAVSNGTYGVQVGDVAGLFATVECNDCDLTGNTLGAFSIERSGTTSGNIQITGKGNRLLDSSAARSGTAKLTAGSSGIIANAEVRRVVTAVASAGVAAPVVTAGGLALYTCNVKFVCTTGGQNNGTAKMSVYIDGGITPIATNVSIPDVGTPYVIGDTGLTATFTNSVGYLNTHSWAFDAQVSRIRLDRVSQGAAPGFLSASLLHGASLTIASSNAGDTGLVRWEIEQ